MVLETKKNALIHQQLYSVHFLEAAAAQIPVCCSTNQN